ncbi:hypothetical protein SAMN04488548_12745 [Gordonia westfalica]|uniref:Uncharacterized protein n=1 Tax=Gordonia westfalica TaxID=158898 RepID=A0A1H2E4C5_9ACTN|nr:hypothetical protein SAMN04488548_12745 [Gordonia westfalica]
MLELLAAQLVRAVVMPATWIQARQMRKAAALSYEQQARAECGCGICAVMEDLSHRDFT